MKPISLVGDAFCQSIAPKRYKYAGFWDRHYIFVRRDVLGFIYKVMRCNESDLTADKLAVMVQSGASR